MPFGLGWENPDPDASSGIGGDDEATAAAAAPPESAQAAEAASPSPNTVSSPSPPRKNNKKSGTRSDGRKTSTTKGGGSSKKKKKSSKDKQSTNTSTSSRRKHVSSSSDDRPEPLKSAGTAAKEAAAAAASGASGVAAVAAAPEAAEDDAPSPHKSRRHKSSSGGSGKKTRGAPQAPPPRGSPRSSSNGKHRSSGSRSRSNTKQSSTRTKSGARTNSSGRRPSGSPRSSPRASPSRDRNNNTSMDTAAATASGVADGPLVSPTETDNTRETSYDSWKENGSSEGAGDGNGDIETGAASPRPSSSRAQRSYKDKSGSGRSGSRSKNTGKSGSRPKSSSGKGGDSSRHQSRSSSNRPNRSGGNSGRSRSRRQTSRSRRKYDYVSCCGWEWKKTHLLGLTVALILVAGGAVAALLFTGILGTGGGGSSQASDFSSITTSPTASPTEDAFMLSDDGGSRPTSRPTRRNDDGSRPVASDQDQNQPTASAPGTSPMPTSCTETTDLFKYFDDAGSVITTNCKKVALSTEVDEVKCRRTVVFGGGYTVRNMCPITCGDCQFQQSANGEDDEPMLTDKPTAFTLEPTPAPKPVAVPTLATTSDAEANPSEGFTGHETFSFYVMGDIPYMYKQDLTLIDQLRDQTNTLDPKEEIFQVHVGDIQNPKRTQCASSHFDKIAGYFKTYSKLPNLILPGDNDWNDCPNPDLAWQYWQTNFVPFEQYWSDTSDFPGTVMRQAGQRENFAFVRAGILFFGLNLVGGQTNEYVTEADWDQKIDNDIAWAQFHMDRLNVGSPRADPTDEDYIRAVIIFGHSPRGRRFNNFLMQRLYNSNLPVVYLHGNGHTYEAVQPFLSDGWSNYWRIQVDQGFNAPPAKVTVRGTTPEALRSSMSINGGKVFPGGFIKLDRRGGLYEGAVATDADGNPLISGVGG